MKYILIIFILAGVCSCESKSSQEIANLETQVEELRNENMELNNKINDLKSEIDECEATASVNAVEQVDPATGLTKSEFDAMVKAKVKELEESNRPKISPELLEKLKESSSNTPQ